METFKLRLPRLKTCCCALSLETGSKIVAIINVVFIGGMFLFGFVMLSINQYQRFLSNHHDYFNDFSHSFIREEFAMTMAVTDVFFSAVLLYGIYKRDATYMEPWLVMKAFLCSVNLLTLLLLIYDRILYFKHPDVFVILAYIAVDVYTNVVVYSFYSEVRGKVADIS